MEALNQKERSFAEENHGLIYAFLNYYKLPEEAIGKSIIKFLNEQEAEDGKDTASRPG